MLEIHRPSDSEKSEVIDDDKHIFKRLREKPINKPFNRAAAQEKAEELNKEIKILERELADFDENELSVDDPAIVKERERLERVQNRFKISDENWKFMVGVMGSGVIILLIMVVNMVIAIMLGGGGEEEE